MNPSRQPTSVRLRAPAGRRRLITDPRRILRGLLKPGDTVLDLGCGPGFFTLPMAEMVGGGGRVAAADVQPDILTKMVTPATRRVWSRASRLLALLGETFTRSLGGRHGGLI